MRCSTRPGGRCIAHSAERRTVDTFYYLLTVEDDLEPAVEGPFDSSEERDKAAKSFREEGFEGGLFPLDVRAPTEPILEVGVYSGGFFEKEVDES